jgi:hypothetical protein
MTAFSSSYASALSSKGALLEETRAVLRRIDQGHSIEDGEAALSHESSHAAPSSAAEGHQLGTQPVPADHHPVPDECLQFIRQRVRGEGIPQRS